MLVAYLIFTEEMDRFFQIYGDFFSNSCSVSLSRCLFLTELQWMHLILMAVLH